MLRKFALVLGLTLPVLGVAVAILSLSQMKNEFLGSSVGPVQRPAHVSPDTNVTPSDSTDGSP
jgi:hypothetical protein